MPDNNMTDHDLLVETHTMTKEIWKAVYGNGREGMLAKVARNDERLAALEGKAVSTGEKVVTRTGGVAGVLAVLVILIEEVLSRLP